MKSLSYKEGFLHRFVGFRNRSPSKLLFGIWTRKKIPLLIASCASRLNNAMALLQRSVYCLATK